ncbi:Rrf2 family transcriptional regulator [Isosphaeraceae bacterium EP7]
MQPSAKCDYALLALYALAEHTDPSPLKAGEIAHRHNIPIKFLEAILNQLKGGGYVISRRGAEGGYHLARPAADISLGNIIRLIDGPDATGRPKSSLSSRSSRLEPSPFAGFWGRIGESIARLTDQTTLADIVKEQAQSESYSLDWVI